MERPCDKGAQAGWCWFRREIAELGWRSILSATIATCTSGAVAGLLT